MGCVEFLDPAADPRWDSFVEKHEFGWLCHLSGWKKVLESTFRHMRGFYPAIVNGREIKAALPVYEVKSWLTGKRLVSIPFASLCDPLISSEREMEDLFSSVLDLFGRLGAGKIEIRTFHCRSILDKKGVDCSRHYKNHSLELQKPEVLQKKFHRTCVRQKISRAQKSNFILTRATGARDIAEFYRLYCVTRRKLGLPAQPFKFFRNIWEAFSPSGRVEVLFAEKDGRKTSSLFLFRFRDRVSAEYLGWDEEFSEMSPNHFVFWEAIKAAHADGFKVFDFGRTSPASESLMEFKSRWGTQVSELPQVYYPLAGNGSALAASRKYIIIHKLCQSSPEFIYPLLGNFCYRHLG